MRSTNLKNIVELLEQNCLLSEASPVSDSSADEVLATEICGCAHDSRDVQPGNVFVCKGVAFEAPYLEKALAAGAAAYVCDEMWAEELVRIAPATPAIVVTDIRRAMSIVAKEAWGAPDADLKIVGITGTKGKTTATYMLRDIIDAGTPHSKAAIMGTIEKFDGVECYESRQTTPEAPELWRHLAHAADAGLAMVMEVSSQGLKYGRTDGVAIDIGCFLNIGEDHISEIEHPSFEDYFASKLKLFEQCDRAVVCLETDYLNEVLDAAQKRCSHVTTISTERTDADFYASNISAEGGVVRFVCHTPEWTDGVVLAIAGTVNVENALAAIACAQLVGAGQTQTLEALATCRVPGHMELYTTADARISAIVDFAHNPISFDRVLGSLRNENPDRWMVVVFGCTGGKALSRREGMAEAAATYCDHIILTEDDPGPEDPLEIAQDVATYLPSRTSYEIEVDRPAAIARAFELADTHAAPHGALVCVLGKGNEADQFVNGVEVPCESDAEIVKRCIDNYDASHEEH